MERRNSFPPSRSTTVVMPQCTVQHCATLCNTAVHKLSGCSRARHHLANCTSATVQLLFKLTTSCHCMLQASQVLQPTPMDFLKSGSKPTLYPSCARFQHCTMCRFGSFKCVRLKSDADSSKFSFFFSHSKKLSVSDFTRTHFLIFEKNLFSNSKL